MADADLIARIALLEDPSDASGQALIKRSRRVAPVQQLSCYNPREPTPVPSSPLNASDNGEIYTELRFSSTPRSSHGFLVGRNPHCDVVLPNLPGLSHFHFSITFDDHGRLIVKDLHSTIGTQVTFDRRGHGVRRGFQWIIGGAEMIDEATIVVSLSKRIRFRIRPAISEKRLNSPTYRALVDTYRRGSADTSTLFESLDLKLQQETERPSTAHTPGSEPIYLDEYLGRGSFGVVTRFWNVSNSSQHIVKRPPLELVRTRKVDHTPWQHEARMMSLVSEKPHPHIVQFFTAVFDPYPQLFFEFVPLGSLDGEHFNDLSILESHAVLCQCLSALVYLHGHEPPIAHRDIKPANILVQSRDAGKIHVKLGDFGMAKDYGSLSSICGSRAYLAPEIYVREYYSYLGGRARKSYTAAVDIWSLGVVVYELTTFSLPKWDPSYVNGGLRWCEKVLEQFQKERENHTNEIDGLLREGMLVLSPFERASAATCLEHALRVDIDSAIDLSSFELDTPNTSRSAGPANLFNIQRAGDGDCGVDYEDDDGAETIRPRQCGFSDYADVSANADSVETERRAPTPQALPQQTPSRQGAHAANEMYGQPQAPTDSLLAQPLWSRSRSSTPVSSRTPLNAGHRTQKRQSVGSLRATRSRNRQRGQSMSTTQPHFSTRELLFDKSGLVSVVLGRQEVCMQLSEPYRLNASQMFSAANTTTSSKSAVLHVLECHKVLEWKGTGRKKEAWVPFRDGVFLCRLLGLEGRLERLLQHARVALPAPAEDYLAKCVHFAKLRWCGRLIPYQPQERIVHIARLLGTMGITKPRVEAYLKENPSIERKDVTGHGIAGLYISYDDIGLVCGHFASRLKSEDERREQLLALPRRLSSAMAADIPDVVRSLSTVDATATQVTATQVTATPAAATPAAATPAAATEGEVEVASPTPPADPPSTGPSPSDPPGDKVSYFTEADYRNGSYLAPASTSYIEGLLGGAAK